MSTGTSAGFASEPEAGATFVLVCRTCGQTYGEPIYLEWAGRAGDVVLPAEPDGNCPACSTSAEALSGLRTKYTPETKGEQE